MQRHPWEQPVNDRLTILAPTDASLERWKSSALSPVFADTTTSFLSALSAKLMSSKEARVHSELVALGFWLRSANLERFAKQLSGFNKPLGSVIHFTPSNVDTMFIYSWVCSLLMGNRNLVRVASQETDLRITLFDILNQVLILDEFASVREANLFVSYDKQSQWSQSFSQLADARVIWGGDESVQTIRALTAKPRCRDISFADRHSAALINGSALGDASTIADLAQKLWKDTQPYQQQACSSPRILYWIGETEKQLALFAAIDELASQQPRTKSQRNEHLVSTQLLQATGQAKSSFDTQSISAVNITEVNEAVYQANSGNGLFFVYTLDNVESLTHLMDSKTQTLSHWGVDKTALLKVLENPSITGIDRVVPVGQALDFDVLWDGFDLFSQLSRRITVE